MYKLVTFDDEMYFKGLVHPKWKSWHHLLSLTVFHARKSFAHLWNKSEYTLVKTEIYVHPLSPHSYHFDASKSS